MDIIVVKLEGGGLQHYPLGRFENFANKVYGIFIICPLRIIFSECSYTILFCLNASGINDYYKSFQIV